MKHPLMKNKLFIKHPATESQHLRVAVTNVPSVSLIKNLQL